MGFIVGLAITLVFLIGGWVFGRMSDRKHLASIHEREQKYKDVLLDNRKRVSSPETVEAVVLVQGQYVAASDYFKAVATRLRGMVGGEMRSIMMLMDRARREAVLRMVEDALAQGATEVWNIRFETSNINQMAGKSGAAQVELIAYGTAVKRRPSAEGFD